MKNVTDDVYEEEQDIVTDLQKVFDDKSHDGVEDWLVAADQLKENDKAVRFCYEAALKISPDDVDALIQYAYYLNSKNAFNEAVSKAKRATQVDKASEDAWEALVEVYKKASMSQEEMEAAANLEALRKSYADGGLKSQGVKCKPRVKQQNF